MRYTRQELKHDSFSEKAADAVHWTVEHRQKLITAAIAAAVLIAIVVGVLAFMNYRGEQAKNALANAMLTYNAPIAPAGAAPAEIKTFPTQQERDTAAKAAFYEVAGKYSSTKSGKYARYFAAICEQNLGNTKGAEDLLKQIEGNDDLGSLARFALASLYRNTNREPDAVKMYKDLIDHPASTVPKASAQLELADLYTEKQPEEAKKIYNEIVKADNKTAAAQIAQQRLSEIK